MFFVLLAFGMPSKTQKIVEPVPNRPAAAAGLKAGDVLVEANGQTVDAEHPISEVIQAGAGRAGQHQGPARRPADDLQRHARPEQRASTRSASRSAPSTSGRRSSLGVAAQGGGRLPVLRVGRDPRAASTTWSAARCRPICRGRSGSPSRSPRRPTAARSTSSRCSSMLSVYLGLFNLLPLPALDGGRAVFLGIESVMRRRVNPRIEAAVHTAGSCCCSACCWSSASRTSSGRASGRWRDGAARAAARARLGDSRGAGRRARAGRDAVPGRSRAAARVRARHRAAHAGGAGARSWPRSSRARRRAAGARARSGRRDGRGGRRRCGRASAPALDVVASIGSRRPAS